MVDENLVQKLKDRLQRALKSKAVLTERSKQLNERLDDARRREDETTHVVNEMIERQREMNFMLHRANTVLHRMQEANTVLSTEFAEMVKELPSAESADWEDRVAKINDLFKKTGSMSEEVQEEIFQRGLDTRPPTSSIREPEQPSADVEPEEVERIETDEIAAEAIETSFDAIDAPEPAVEEQTQEPEAVEEIETPVEDEPSETRIDRLFARLDEIDDIEPVESASARKPGAIARLWNRLRGQSDGIAAL